METIFLRISKEKSDLISQMVSKLKKTSDEPPLLTACRWDRDGISKFDLVIDFIIRNEIHKDSDANFVGSDGFSALYYAIQQNKIENARMLLNYFKPLKFSKQHDRDIIALAMRQENPEMKEFGYEMISQIAEEFIHDNHEKTRETRERDEIARRLIEDEEREEEKKRRQREKKKEQKMRAKLRKQSEKNIHSSTPVSLSTPDFNKFGSDKPDRKEVVEEVNFVPFVKLNMRSRSFRKRFFRYFKRNRSPRMLKKVSYRPYSHDISRPSLIHVETIKPYSIKKSDFSLRDLVVSSEKPKTIDIYEKRWMERIQNPPYIPLMLRQSNEKQSFFQYRNDDALGMFSKSIFFP
jgi:hypothetical protein